MAYKRNYSHNIVFRASILNVQFTIKGKYLRYYLTLINIYLLNYSYVNSTFTTKTFKTYAHTWKKIKFIETAIIAYVTLISMLPLTNFPD